MYGFWKELHTKYGAIKSKVGLATEAGMRGALQC